MNIKTRLKLLLRDIGIKQDELYSLTGYNFNDVETETIFSQVKKIL